MPMAWQELQTTNRSSTELIELHFVAVTLKQGKVRRNNQWLQAVKMPLNKMQLHL